MPMIWRRWRVEVGEPPPGALDLVGELRCSAACGAASWRTGTGPSSRRGRAGTAPVWKLRSRSRMSLSILGSMLAALAAALRLRHQPLLELQADVARGRWTVGPCCGPGRCGSGCWPGGAAAGSGRSPAAARRSGSRGRGSGCDQGHQPPALRHRVGSGQPARSRPQRAAEPPPGASLGRLAVAVRSWHVRAIRRACSRCRGDARS